MNLSKNFLLLILLLFLETAGACSGGDRIAYASSPADFKDVVLIGWDGVNKQRLKELLNAGRLPNLKKIINEGEFIDTEVTTGTTSTKSGWAEILTGYSYRITGVYNNRREYRPIPTGFTIFERLKSYRGYKNISTVFLAGKLQNLGSRGPHRVWPNGGRKIWWNEDLWDKTKIKDEEILNMEGEPYAITKNHVDIFENGLGRADHVGQKALSYVQRFKDSRFFLFAHFEEPDEQGHEFGEGSKEYSQAIERDDYWLGRIIEKLENLKLYDKTLIYLTTDHGFGNNEIGEKAHAYEPHTFLVSNDKALTVKSGDRKDITPTLLYRYGVDITSINPSLEGHSLVTPSRQPRGEDRREVGKYGKSKDTVYKGMNFIMISINNIGIEHMSLYGYNRKTTPHLDKWSEDAIVFENVFSPVSWTLPAITSVFTSLNPYTHGVMDRNHGNLLNVSIKTLPEILEENGYETAAFCGGLDDMKLFGHMRGFKTTDDNPPFTGFDVTLSQAKKWLTGNSKKKFFLFIQGYDAHPPFTPPKEFKGIFSNPKGKNITIDPTHVVRGFRNSDNQYLAYYTHIATSLNYDKSKYRQKPMQNKAVILTQDDIEYLKDLYDEEVLSVDDKVSQFLTSLGRDALNNTIIVIFSEHGEMFAKHGRFGRAGAKRGTLYDDVIHVPLIIKIPRQEGRRIKGLVQLVDVMPTLLGMLDISYQEPIQGKSLLPLINGNEPLNDFVYAGALYNVGKHEPDSIFKPASIDESIRNYDWKLIHEVIFLKPYSNGENRQEETFELYDLKKDPSELYNVIGYYPHKAKELKEKLMNWVNWCRSNTTPPATNRELSAKLINEAREHGYW